MRGNNQNTVKVQATPDSALLRAMKTALGGKICTEGGATKFVELGGKPVTTGLSGSDKFTANSGCFFQNKCNIDPEKDCRVTRSVYSVECTNCTQDPTKVQTLYYGTSGRALHLRQVEHLKDIEHCRRSNALYKHAANEHNGNAVFRSKPIIGGFKYNVDRFIYESLKIQEGNCNDNLHILNSRSEWGHRGLPRLMLNQN